MWNFDLKSTPDVRVGTVRYPAPVERRWDWSPAVLQIFDGKIHLEATIEIASGAVAGLRTITAELSYQACINGACLPPNSQAVDVVVEIRR